MKSIAKCLLLLSIGLFIYACSESNNPSTSASNHDCEFVEKNDSTDGLLDETEIQIIKECRDNKLTTNSEIQSNLIGEWELVGFGDGWFSNINQPCGFIKVEENQLTFEFHNEYLDTISVHTWEIENQWLKVDPPEEHLSIQTFCEQYMHGTHSPFGSIVIDVDSYIYEKVK